MLAIEDSDVGSPYGVLAVSLDTLWTLVGVITCGTIVLIALKTNGVLAVRNLSEY